MGQTWFQSTYCVMHTAFGKQVSKRDCIVPIQTSDLSYECDLISPPILPDRTKYACDALTFVGEDDWCVQFDVEFFSLSFSVARHIESENSKLQ